jgi:diguanylate cyclase (GGDEF)-like protein/PAS domain S-box-containing protein
MDAATVYSSELEKTGAQGSLSADLLACAFDGLPDVALIAVDRDLRLIWCAGGLLAHLCQRAEPIAGRPLAGFLAPGTFATYEPRFRAALEGRHTQLEAPTSAGGPAVYLTKFISVRGADGEIVGALGMAHDISGRLANAIAHQQWERCFQATTRGIALANTHTNLLERVNVAFADMHGGVPDDFVGMPVTELYPPTARSAVPERSQRADHGEALEFETEHARLDGSRFPVQVELITTPAISGQAGYRIGWVSDLSAQREVERARREASVRFETAFANAPVGMAIVSLDGRWLKTNEALAKLTGYSTQELAELTFQDITHPDDLDTNLELVRQTIAGEIPSYEMEKRYVTKQGQCVWSLLSVSMVRDLHGEPSYFISQIQDISAHKRMEERLRHLADCDPLTDLWNRRRFDEELARQQARCARYGEQATLLMVDLDRFKTVNDTYGHKMGDAAILAVADILRERLRKSDSVARIGGDEFAAVLVNVDIDHAYALAEGLRAAIGALMISDGEHTASITASLGVVTIRETIAAGREPLTGADQAMYRAKRAGRDRVAR